MSEVLYRSHVRVVREKGAYRTATLPATPEPVDFGVHSAIARFYGMETETEMATTLDYVVAATAG